MRPTRAIAALVPILAFLAAPFGCETRSKQTGAAAPPATPAAPPASNASMPPKSAETTAATPTSAPLVPGPPAILSFELTPGPVHHREVLRIEPPRESLSTTEAFFAKSVVPGKTRIVFLNRKGGSYKPGTTNSATNTTPLAEKPGTLPPYEKGEVAWKQLAACIHSKFSRWNLQFTEDDPGSSQQHIELVIGGHPSTFGMDPTVGGVASLMANCSVNDGSIAFVFSKIYKPGDLDGECETAAHELGHALGLDHAFHCPDPMTYLVGCGSKAFRSDSVACGESKARPCACSPTQSSVAVLDKNVGLSSTPSAPPIGTPGPMIPPFTSIPGTTTAPTSTATPPKPTSAPTTPPPPSKKGDGKGPNVALLAPATGTKVASGSEVVLLARVDDGDGVGKVLLRWKMGSQLTEIDCAAPPAGVSCNAAFGTWAFRLPSGKGSRSWSIRAIDAAGNETTSEERTVVLSDDAPTSAPPIPPGLPIPPPPATTPQPTTIEVAISSPDEGKVFHWGASVPVKVTVKGTVTTVQLVWTSTFGDEIQPLAKGDGDSWNGTLTIPNLALPGPRKLRALVQVASGSTLESKPRTIVVMP